MAVAAFASLAARSPEVVLVVARRRAGPFGRRPPRAGGPGPGARCSGPSPNGDLPPVHAACELYLGPATGGESFGIVARRGDGRRAPAWWRATSPGYDEVVRDGVDGLLVPPRDAAAVARAAERILGDADLAARLAAAGRERAASFDWGVVAERIEAVYRSVLDEPSVR